MRTLIRAAALPTLSGVLYFLSWIGFGIWPLAFVCFVPLVWSLRDASLPKALALGAWMGFITHLGGYTWVIHLLRVFAFLPWPLASLGYVLLCAGQGFLFGVFACLLRWSWRRTGWPIAALLPVALCATEFAYPLLFQSYTGAALMPLRPIIQVADLGGPLLLTALQAAINGAAGDVLLWRAGRTSRSPLGSMLAASLAVALSAGYGAWRLKQVEAQEASAPHLRVGLSQPNVGEHELHENPQASVQTLRQHTYALSKQGAELVIWPEAAFNTRPVQRGDATMGRIIQGGVPVSIIAGVVRTDGSRIWNSAVMVSRSGMLGDYFDKINLLAFGEYIPFGDWFPIVYRWSPMSSHMTRGETTAPLRDGPWRFATFICYEDILPALVRKTMEDHGSGRANAMVNLTNDSWYGAGHEQEQHLQLAALRSAEHHRWLLRATSTGISAFVDATGQVVQRIPRDVRGTAIADVPMLEGTTAYEVLGDWPGWMCGAALVAIAVRFRRRGRQPLPVSGTRGQSEDSLYLPVLRAPVAQVARQVP
jgi:apolipoprotein N-acyltransferase